MSLTMPHIEVGEPRRLGALCVFPLFTESDSAVTYRLAEDAIEEGSLVVEELGESGTVPELLARNDGDAMALFLEGQHLIGAKQNRILNASVLVAAGETTKIPVSCVEAGRWSQSGRRMSSHPGHAPHSLRHKLHSDSCRSVLSTRKHTTDQSAVWGKIDEIQKRTSTHSTRKALSDSHRHYDDKRRKLLESFAYQEGASGVGVTWQGRVLSIDVFDKPETCRRVWPRLISSHMFTMGEKLPGKPKASATNLRKTLADASKARWDRVPPACSGEEYRARTEELWASSLGIEGEPVHLAVLAEDLEDDAIE